MEGGTTVKSSFCFQFPSSLYPLTFSEQRTQTQIYDVFSVLVLPFLKEKVPQKGNHWETECDPQIKDFSLRRERFDIDYLFFRVGRRSSLNRALLWRETDWGSRERSEPISRLWEVDIRSTEQRDFTPRSTKLKEFLPKRTHVTIVIPSSYFRILRDYSKVKL